MHLSKNEMYNKKTIVENTENISNVVPETREFKTHFLHPLHAIKAGLG